MQVMFLIGDKNNQTNEKYGIEVITPIYSVKKDTDKENLLNNYKKSYPENDYSILEITDINIIDRISKQDLFIPVWQNNELVGIDFTPEDTKIKLKVEVTKNVVTKGDNDSVIIKCTVLNADDTQNTDFNDNLLVPIMTPDGEKKLYVSFVNGYKEYEFNPTAGDYSHGQYIIPNRRTKDFNIKSQAVYEVVIPIV